MRTKILLAALACIVLVSCVKEEPSNKLANQVKITFESPVINSNVGTKANVYGEIGKYTYTGSSSTYSYPRAEDFIIYAVKHSGDFTSWTATGTENCLFNGQTLKYDPSVDSWAPKTGEGSYYYWPDGKKLSFAALSPADLELAGVTPTYGNVGLSIPNFVVNDDPAKQYDLMFSKRVVDQTSVYMIHGADAYSGIPINFQHALSSVHFSIKKDAGVTEDVVLLDVTINSVKNKGSFCENITETTPWVYDRSAAGNVKPAWTVDPSSKRAYQAFKGKVKFPLEAQYVSAVAASDTDNPADPNDVDVSHALLMMPQELGDDVILTVKYQVGNAESITRNIQINTFPTATPITEWLMGYKYTYRLYYSKDSEKKDIIFFSPSSDEWSDGGVIEILL